LALISLKEILKRTGTEKYAVGNFDVFNIEMLKGVIEAAEETNSPVIIAYGEGFESYIDIEGFASLVIKLAEKSPVPVTLHLDHAVKFESILKAVNCGFTSVMIDSSEYNLGKNIENTRKAVEVCKVFGVSVEAELGHVSGLTGLYSNDESIYTNVEEAEKFIMETEVDALAIAIGTVHGVYKEKPRLNLARLQEIKKLVNIPLVLHGGSGLSDDDFRTMIKNGISKINIFTDLTLEALKSSRNDSGNTQISYMDLCLNMTKAVKAEAVKKMKLFGCINKNWL
jgi:fructose-bisphosphate aldolase, class II